MKIGLIDNDFVVRKNHNFPNLALMKISNYHKSIGDEVKLIGFNEINPYNLFNTNFDKIIISKAFTDSPTPEFITTLNNIEKGGTGFYFDLAKNLPNEIEHIMPDYNLYDDFLHIVKNKKYYTEYSIGYTTRGCFRHCEFCVNKKSNKVALHSDIEEFYNTKKPKITLLDDNILGLSNKNLFNILDKLKEINKPFQYKQGLDIRLITEVRAKRIINMRYDGDYIFAFDKWKDKEIIERKLELFSKQYRIIKSPKTKRIPSFFYVFCAFDYNNKYNIDFWENDLILIFKRISILFKYGAMPFVMRYEMYKKSPFYKIYIEITQWANQPRNCAKYSYNEYIDIANKKESKILRNKNKELRDLFDVRLVSN